MAILTTDQNYFEGHVKASRIKYSQIVQDQTKRSLRVMFDNTKLDYDAEAIIRLTKELGYHTLAAEMEVDFFLEADRRAA